MLNKESVDLTNVYKNLQIAAYSSLDKMKLLFNFDDENWEKCYQKCFISFENLLRFQKSIKSEITDLEIFRSAYYLSWMENANYCRTGDFRYLNNAKEFFHLIRKICHFKDKRKRSSMEEVDKMSKYYSRFIWICMLVNDKILIRDLMEEFKAFISVNKNLMQAEKFYIYNDCIIRINQFYNSLQVFNVVEANSDFYNIETRLVSTNQNLISYSSLILTEVVICSFVEKQIEFDNRTPDIFRMWQLFECLPQCCLRNPVKRVLIKPKLHEIKSCFLRSITRLKSNNAFVCYISADSHDLNKITVNDGDTDTSINPNFLVSYTRVPLLLIIDSKDSDIFRDLTSLFTKPLICLLSPRIVPLESRYDTKNGNLFTLFLSCPIAALSLICDKKCIEKKHWNSAQNYLQDFNEICLSIINKTIILEDYRRFISDPFMKRIILGYCFCSVVLRVHKYFNKPEYHPLSNPSIDSVLSENADLKEIVYSISRAAKLNEFF